MIGSISHGTMLPEDLIPLFIDKLDELKEQASLLPSTASPEEGEQSKQEYKRLDDLLGDIEQRAQKTDYFESAESDCDLETLFAELDQLALPYTYFGASEGDGADYGFWIAWESLNEDCRFGNVLKINAGDIWPEPLPEEVQYVLEVNDHGNATLLTPEGKEIWSAV